jgi:hypothetical protein
MDSALEAVERARTLGRDHLERLVVIVSAGVARLIWFRSIM